jgi:hypothetical protein
MNFYAIAVESVYNWIEACGFLTTHEVAVRTVDSMNRAKYNYTEQPDRIKIIPIPLGVQRLVTDGGRLNYDTLKILTISEINERDILSFYSQRFIVEKVEIRGDDLKIYQAYLKEVVNDG